MDTLREPLASSARILGLVEGNAQNALSGIPHFLFAALERRFSNVQVLDYAPQGIERIALAAANFRPSRTAWRARYHTSRLSHRALSRNLIKRTAKVNPDFDVALQVLGWVHGQPKPYTLYVDQTRLMAECGWPEWLPFTARERSQLLALEREMYNQASHVFVMGEPARDSLIGHYSVEPSCVTTVGGGANFETLPIPEEPAPAPNILFVGRDFGRKGGHDLIAAFAFVREQVPDATLHLVGSSDRRQMSGVVIHGEISGRRHLEELFRDARVLCLPSRYEPFGLALVEAMAHGVPCVGTTVQSIPEILDHGRAGLLIPPGEPEDLAQALLRLLIDEDLARSIGAAGRRRVEDHYTWDRVAGRIASALLQAGLISES